MYLPYISHNLKPVVSQPRVGVCRVVLTRGGERGSGWCSELWLLQYKPGKTDQNGLRSVGLPQSPAAPLFSSPLASLLVSNHEEGREIGEKG